MTPSSRRSRSPVWTGSSPSSGRWRTRSTATPSAPEPPSHPLDTGNTAQDAQSDFSRARRARMLAAIGRRLRREPDDVALILPFEEVVEALGRVGETDAGLHTVPIEAIVGSVDRLRDFDRRFRPTTSRTRVRCERIARAPRLRVAVPPVALYRGGDLYFGRGARHRVAGAGPVGHALHAADVAGG